MTAVLNTAIKPKLQAALGSQLYGQELVTKINAAINGTVGSAVNTAYNNTDATGTLTAAAIVGGLITRTGETSAFTDTTDTAVAIVAAISGGATGMAWILRIKNTVAFAGTLSAGSGVTLSGLTVIPPLATGEFLVTITSPTAVSILGFGSEPLMALPAAQYITAALTTGTLSAGQITGANRVYLEQTTDGAASMTTRTAAQMFTDTPNAQIGGTYEVILINSGNNTLTLVAGSNVTITGTATVATLTTRTFVVTFTDATHLVMQGVNKGSIEAT